MDPIRRPPWEVSSGNDFPSIDPRDQYQRDLIRLQMIERDRSDAEANGRPDLAAAAQREMNAVRKQMGGATAALPAEQGPLRAPPWEQQQAAPSRGSYDFPLPSEMIGKQSSDGFFRRSLDIPTKFAAGIPSAISSAVGLVGAAVPWARGAADPLAELFSESAQAINKNFLSDYQQQKEQELAKRLAANPGFFEGAGEGFKFLGEHPLYAVPSLAESIPSMLAGGYLGRGLQVGARGLGYRMPASTAGALGEGGMITGSVGTDIARQDPEASRVPAFLAGAGGAVVGKYGARLMGGADIESAIAGRLARGEAADILSSAGTAGGRFVRGVVGEGFLEEAPQSVMERMATNYSSGRPIMEGTGGEAVIGAASGAMMGGGFGLRRPSNTYTPDELKASLKVMADPRSVPEDAVAAADFVRRVETGTLGEAEANKRFNDYLNDVFGSKVEPGGESFDMLKDTNRSPKEIMAELRRSANDPNEPSVWRFPVSTGLEGSQRGMFAAGPEAFNQPRPVTGELGSNQQAALGGTAPLGAGQIAAMAGPVDQNAPRPATGLGPAQQIAAGGPEALTSAGTPVQQTVPSGGATTTVPSSAPAAPGAFSSDPTPPSPAGVTIMDGNNTRVIGEARANELAADRNKATGTAATPAAKTTKTTPKVSAPKKTTIARSIEQALDEEMEVADTALDNARAKKIMADVNSEDLGAEVQGAKQIKAPGRVSLSQRSLLGIRDAIFRKSGKVAKAFGKKEQKVVDAVSEFTNAYNAYLNFSTNIADELKQAKGTDAAAGRRIPKLEDRAKDVQNALFNLGQSLDNNAKNVEAIVRVVKDTVQQKLAKPGKTKKETLEAMTSLDTVLSSGWAAAKRETFMSELPDLADVSGQTIRQSTEQQVKGNTTSKLEKAAKDGYGNPKGTAEKEFGLIGVLQYLRFNTTPMGKVLARMLRDALQQSVNPAKVVFTDKVGSRYVPKTNTVYINRGEQSAEVVLHETFHAALQWYVYQNPSAPAVKQLELSLKRALEAKGLQGKALEVQNILQNLVNNERGLDAVLELVSYTATLNEFRRAMQEIKTGDAPKSFLESVKAVWAMYKAIVRRLLGSNDTVASDVLSASMQLLEESTTATMPAKLEGKPLPAVVQSNKATQSAAGITAQDYRGYTKRIAPAAISTKAFFDVVGWNENVAKKFTQTTSKMAEAIRKDFPSLERFLIYVNSRFSAGAMTSQEIENYKVNKSVGYQQMERLANFVTNRSATEIRALFDYMDGNKKALDGLADKGVMTRTADNVMEWFKTYVADLPAAERSFFTTRKFSESLLYASKSAQVASSTFGARKLSKVLGLKHESENTLEGFMDWLEKDGNGDVVLDGRFYEVFKNDGLRPGDGPEHAGYMSVSEFEKRGRKAPDGYQVDATREWWMSQYDPDRGYKFSSSMTAKQAIQENKVDDLANAMRNTMAALANNYASRQFSKALAADKSIAFDSLEDIKAFSGQVIDEALVLKVSQEESKSPQISSLYRNSGTWVKLPDSAAYGDLANKYIPGPVWSAMTDMADRRPLVEFGLYNDIMRWFKKSKTVYNPGTHITNVASNITLAMMHDIPMSTLGKAARVFALFETNPKALTDTELDMMSSFINSGAMLGDFSSAEVKKALYDAWKDNMAPANDNSLMKRLAAFTNYEKSKAQKAVEIATKIGKKADHYATELYAAEDNIFRLAAFLTKAGDLQARDKTSAATPEQLREAGDFARKAFLDYDIDSKAVRVLRQSMIPFISWGYAVAPVLGRIALHQPWKIANIVMAYYLLDIAMASMGGGDDDELREKGPEYMRERMFFGNFGPRMYIRIPFMGDAENPVYYKLGDYVPFASITKGLPNGLFGQSWIPSVVTPSGPFVSAVAGLLLGVDPYTGKDIHKPTDSEWDKLFNSATFAYDTAMPSMVSSKNISKVKDIIDEKEGITGVKPSNLVMARMLGFKLYDYNVDESMAIQDKVVKGIEKDFKAAMTRAKKEEYRKGYPDYEALDKELEVLRERMEKRVAEVRGGEEEEE